MSENKINEAIDRLVRVVVSSLSRDQQEKLIEYSYPALMERREAARFVVNRHVRALKAGLTRCREGHEHDNDRCGLTGWAATSELMANGGKSPSTGLDVKPLGADLLAEMYCAAIERIAEYELAQENSRVATESRA